MRIYFKSMARPKRVARTMQDIFPLEKLTQCQAWTAKIYGYRDWYEMEETTAAGTHAPSPDDEDIAEAERSKRGLALANALDKVLGIGFVESLGIQLRINLTSRKPVPSARRVAKAPIGTNPFYTLLQRDILGPDGRSGNASFDEDYYAYAAVPAIYGAEDDYRAKLIKLLKRKARPYPSFAADCEQLLSRPCPDKTDLFWERSEVGKTVWMYQQERQRFYLFDGEANPVGFLELSQNLEAASDTEDNNRLELRIHEAWAAKDAQWLLASVAGTHFFGTANNIAIAWRSSQPMPLDLEIISDSEHLLELGFLEEVAASAADSLGIDPEIIYVSYDV